MKTHFLVKGFCPVLCFEDDKIACRYLVSALRRTGIVVEAFTEPEQAKAALEKNGFRAALLDIVDANKEPTGLDIAEQFRRRHPSDYLEIVTGHNTAAYEERARKIGADRYTCKPVTPTVLVSHVIHGILRRGLANVAQKQHVNLDGLVVDFCREFDIPIPDDEPLREYSPSLAGFIALLKETTVADKIQDPFLLAKLVAAAEKMWAECCRRQGPHEQVALMLLKASRILLRDGPTPEKLAAVTRCADVLKLTSATDDDVCKVDDSLRTAGIDVLVQLTRDET